MDPKYEDLHNAVFTIMGNQLELWFEKRTSHLDNTQKGRFKIDSVLASFRISYSSSSNGCLMCANNLLRWIDCIKINCKQEIDTPINQLARKFKINGFSCDVAQFTALWNTKIGVSNE